MANLRHLNDCLQEIWEKNRVLRLHFYSEIIGEKPSEIRVAAASDNDCPYCCSRLDEDQVKKESKKKIKCKTCSKMIKRTKLKNERKLIDKSTKSSKKVSVADKSMKKVEEEASNNSSRKKKKRNKKDPNAGLIIPKEILAKRAEQKPLLKSSFPLGNAKLLKALQASSKQKVSVNDRLHKFLVSE